MANTHGNAMKLDSIRAAEAQLLLQTYDRAPVLFTGGDGCYLIDESGNRYLDLLSGIGVNALGYGHPVVTDAIAAQSRKLIHTSNLFYHQGQAELALRLTELTGLDRAFFCNSGAEAWEAALKLARAYAGMQRTQGKTIGTKFLAIEGSFHGRTYGAVSTTHKAKYREPFAPVVPGVEFVRLNDVEDLKAKFSQDVCAVLLEAIQGEAGIRPMTQEFMTAARELTRSTGALLIVDEIQAGVGRTGKWCAYQHYNVLPDVTTLAKPLAGGIPMGAMLCTDEVAQAIHPGMHGTTFGGNALACGVAIAVVDYVRSEEMTTHVQQTGDYFKDQMARLTAAHQGVVDVRGQGLMLAMELSTPELAKTLQKKLMDRRIIVNLTGETILRFLPPYIITKAEIDLAIAALDELLQENNGTPAVKTLEGDVHAR